MHRNKKYINAPHTACVILEGNMKGGKLPLGYTIIEVMIVLAVSAVMFLIAANFISGKQSSTAFTEGTNEFDTEMQSVINQVTDGQYSDVQFTCTSGAGGALTFSLSASPSSTQGTNPPCVYLGKFLYFIQGANPTDYETFSLAGNRQDNATGGPATTLAELNATPIIGGGIDLTTQSSIPQQIEVKSMHATVSGNTFQVYGLGFIQSAGTLDPLTGELSNGAQTIGLVYDPNLNAPDLTEAQAATDITSSIAFADSAQICLTDGTRTAEITFGDNNSNANQLSANLVVTPC